VTTEESVAPYLCVHENPYLEGMRCDLVKDHQGPHRGWKTRTERLSWPLDPSAVSVLGSHHPPKPPKNPSLDVPRCSAAHHDDHSILCILHAGHGDDHYGSSGEGTPCCWATPTKVEVEISSGTLVRPSLLTFAVLMENRLVRNEHRRSADLPTIGVYHHAATALDRLRTLVAASWNGSADLSDLLEQAADVANWCYLMAQATANKATSSDAT
jgi:hypothetical protein